MIRLNKLVLSLGLAAALSTTFAFAAVRKPLTIGLKNFREIIFSLEDATGISSKTPEVQAIYKKVFSRLPVNGDVEELGSPTVLALVELSGSFCNQLVAREAGKASNQRKFFLFVDFAKGPDQFKSSLWPLTVKEMTNAFWQRDPMGAEMDVFTSVLESVLKENPTDATKTPQALQSACVQAASSLAFLTNGI